MLEIGQSAAKLLKPVIDKGHGEGSETKRKSGDNDRLVILNPHKI